MEVAYGFVSYYQSVLGTDSIGVIVVQEYVAALGSVMQEAHYQKLTALVTNEDIKASYTVVYLRGQKSWFFKSVF